MVLLGTPVGVIILSAKLRWYIFSFVFALLLSFEPLLLLAIEEGRNSAGLVLGYITVVSFLYLSSTFVVGKVSSFLSQLLICLFLALSVFVLKIFYYNFLSGLSEGSIAVIIVALAAFIYLAIFRLKVIEKPTVGLYLLSFGVLLVGPLIALQYEKGREGSGNELSDSEQSFLEELSGIELEDKPNIYILSYDSMITASTAEKYLGIENLEYESTLEKHFIILEPAATVSVPSRASLNGLLRLDQKNLESSLTYFSGEKPSAIGQLFAGNGYEITTGYTTYYFGNKGPYVDGYITGPTKYLISTAQCNDPVTNRFHKMRAFGVCLVLGHYSSVNNVVRVALLGEDQHRDWLFDTWPSIILDEIKSSFDSDAPQLKIFYTYRPNGHTPKDYKHSDLEKREDYKKYFLEGAGMLSGVLEDLVLTIEKYDPSSIVVIFGDHGAWLSRGIREADDPAFFYEDRHMVYTSVLASRHPCASVGNLSKYAPGYYTPSRVVASIARCLAGDNKLDALLDFSEPREIVNLLTGKNIENDKGDN